MKKSKVAKLLLVSAVALLAAGCGEEETDPETSNGQISVDSSWWELTTDPATGRTFSCLTTWNKSGYGAGLSTWCYEITADETEGA